MVSVSSGSASSRVGLRHTVILLSTIVQSEYIRGLIYLDSTLTTRLASSARPSSMHHNNLVVFRRGSLEEKFHVTEEDLRIVPLNCASGASLFEPHTAVAEIINIYL